MKLVTMVERVTKVRNLSHSQRRRRQLFGLYKRQGGLCYFCERKMIDPALTYGPPTKKRPDDRQCVVYHLDSRLSQMRGKHQCEFRHVACCWICANETNRHIEANLPIEELWKRSRQTESLYTAHPVSPDNPAALTSARPIPEKEG